MHTHSLLLRNSAPQPAGTDPRLPEVYCIISQWGCFDLYEKVSKMFQGVLVGHVAVYAGVGSSGGEKTNSQSCYVHVSEGN